MAHHHWQRSKKYVRFYISLSFVLFCQQYSLIARMFCFVGLGLTITEALGQHYYGRSANTLFLNSSKNFLVILKKNSNLQKVFKLFFFFLGSQLTVACIKMNRPEIAERAIEVVEKRISADKWPEYYDTKSARFIGKQARLYQTWSIAGYLVAKLLLQNPELAKTLWSEEDPEIINAFNCMIDPANARRKRGRKVLKKTYII